MKSPFCFVAMESEELGADKCFFCLVSILFSNGSNCYEWGGANGKDIWVKIRFSNGEIFFKKKF